MWKSYLKIALRNIRKDKGYSFINIFGLSLGMACGLLIFNYTRFELSYDNFHPDVDRSYRIDETTPRMTDGSKSSSTAPPLAYTMKTTYPEVEEVLRINTPGDFIIRYSDGENQMMSFHENKIFAADSTFFSFFGFPLAEGNPRTALIGANKVVLSKETAKKFFGDGQAVGKILLLGDKRTAIEVTGVTDQQPENGHFHFDYLLSMETNPNVKYRDFSWVWTQMVTYARLKPGSDPSALEGKMSRLLDEVIKPALEKRGMTNALGAGNPIWKFYATPMRDIHLRSGDNRLGSVGDIKYIYAFILIGAFVVLLAVINFVNLSTARGAKRAKEVGVKKTLGALRDSLIYQFQFESILLSFISLVLALAFMEILRLLIAGQVGIRIPMSLWNDPRMLWLLPLMTIAIGFVAGLYPSFYLTRFRPIQVLKGKLTSGMGNPILRNGLVLVQFAISIAMIAGTLIVFQQLRFVSSKNLGFDKENILVVNYAEKLGTHLEAFANELKTYPGVISAGVTTEVPGGDSWQDGISREDSDIDVNAAIVKTDEDYFKTMGFELIGGRTMEKERASDRNAVILNETMVSLLGWTPEQAIGQFLVYPGNENSRHEIIGVMKDFNYQSLHQSIPPLMFCGTESDIWGDWRVITVKFKTDDVPGLIGSIAKNWRKSLDDTPFEYSFLDQDLAKQYKMEQQLGKLFSVFSGLSILIALIGLVGLVSYSAEVRKKEVGIRKVFGATTSRIVVLMNSQYITLILIAFIISIPLTWWAMEQWLNTFVFRIQISPLIFAMAVMAELLLAAMSVGYLSWKAASMNPARVLKEE